MATTYEPIATTTLGSVTASITFSSIPATYTDFRLVVVGTTASAVVGYIRFNGDTASNYSVTRLTGDGSTAGSSRNGPVGQISVGDWYTFQATIPSMLTVDVFSYAGSTYKTALTTTSNDQNGSGYVERCVGLWRNTAAITSITVANSGASNFQVGTTATLYGIKNA